MSLKCVLVFNCFLFVLVRGLTQSDFYLYSEASTEIPRGDDLSSEEVHLKVPIRLYGSLYKSVYINTNGLLSFQTEIPNFFNYEFPLDYPIIAPLYSNIDTRASGTISYNEITNDVTLFRTAQEKLVKNFRSAQQFEIKSIFVATWLECGYHDKKSDKVNSFQVAIFSNGTESFAEFMYPVNGIQWIQGTGSETGLPDARAQAGFIAEDGRYFTLKGSGSNQVQYLEKWSNMNVDGDWLFRIGNIEADANIESPDLVDADKDIVVLSTSCDQGSLQCHESSTCYDYKSGFCCKCSMGFYGNGLSCLKNDMPLRVNGKLRGELNGVKFEDLDIQSYVIMSDGRIYTAISRMAPEIGFDLQLINLLGEIIGWVFAKPMQKTVNGYDLTGGHFEHKATIKFGGDGNKSLDVEHEFLGLDIFDQLRFEAYIHGELPRMDQGPKISIFDYDQVLTFMKTDDNLTMKFGGERSVQLTDQSEQFSYTVEQEIVFNFCKHDSDFLEMLQQSNWKFKVNRNYVIYEKSEQIIRYGMSAKISSANETDPCIEGRRHCRPNSVCVVDNDGFQCVCRPGFQPVESDGSILECQDIDECISGHHQCHEHADCTNEIGRYQCNCKTGYFGDGENCEILKHCSSLNCSHDAECIIDPNYGSRCLCKQGFIGDGKNCMPEPTTLTPIPSVRTEFAFYVPEMCNGTSCVCPQNYFKVDNSSYCQISNPEMTFTAAPDCRTENRCDSNAECIYVHSTTRYDCSCLQGYTGDGRNCEKISTDCRESAAQCAPFASCQYNDVTKSYGCVCHEGFKFVDDVCQLESQLEHLCVLNTDCNVNEECQLKPEKNRNECICKEGYFRDSASVCRTRQDTCGGAICLPIAKCLYDDEVETHYCHCQSGLIGDGVHECKPKPLGCDVTNNCSPKAKCQYNSYDDYHQCVCNDGFYGDGLICSEIKTCFADPYMCDYQASCVFNAEKQLHECQCNSGFFGNGTVCKPQQVFNGNFLVVNQGMATIKIPIDNSHEMAKPLKIHNFQIAVGISTDCHGGRIYWSDINGKSIQSFNYNGSDDKAFVHHDILSPEGISVDWVSRNVYWTDSKKDTIEVMNIDSMKRKAIVKNGLVNPRGIAVHPQRGKIFWSDWNRLEPKIEWSNMDGSARSIFLQGDYVKLPNSLAIDWHNDELCYTDAGTKAIECISIENRSRKTIIKNLTYPFGLAISDYNYYWNDWITGKVEVVDKRSLSKLDSINVPLNVRGNKLYSMTMVPNECPRLTNACHFYQCPSSHLCLPNGINSRICACADNADNVDVCRDYF